MRNRRKKDEERKEEEREWVGGERERQTHIPIQTYNRPERKGVSLGERMA
jgi:hypothetical protein